VAVEVDAEVPATEPVVVLHSVTGQEYSFESCVAAVRVRPQFLKRPGGVKPVQGRA
jgi:hypothetical protein